MTAKKQDAPEKQEAPKYEDAKKQEAPGPFNARAGAEPNRVEHHEKLPETHSSGVHADPLHTEADRVAADPALEPELARAREALAREDPEAADRLEEKGTDQVAKKNR